ncbi:uncharacterized protein LOC131669682 [Phymastichus coffea]|uniref:uncharacterized protein LOC131669682 n=1 Tax=Phymastichus coffea TaxID=108790 RepID=UPI00273C46EB|nr:uncharacterized protein LOC131669682 [Phymastichus coffea]
MARNLQALLPLLIVFVLEQCQAELFYNIIKQEDPCVNRCKDAPLPLTNKDIDPEGKYVTTCCQRGCRFFNLVDLRRELEPSNLNTNASLDACDSTCTEAYTVIQDLIACRIGCAFMANQLVSGLSSLFSIAIRIEDGSHPNILFMSPDIPDNDLLADPGLGKEILPGWWDTDGFKLPETYFKTVPIDSGTVDYGIPSEYIIESEKSTSIPGSDWLQCASRHTGIPRWLLAFVIASAALSALWLCLSPDKSPEPIEKVHLVSRSIPNKVTVYLPDEAPLYKKPPPKYDEIVNIHQPNFEV